MHPESHTMNESFQLEGYWWLPNQSEKKIAGILNYNSEGISLSLMGAFIEIADLSTHKEYPIILGHITNGEIVTLHKNYHTRTTFSHTNSDGFQTEIIRVSELYIGYHFDNSNYILFNSVAVRFSNLSDWVRVSGLTQDLSKLNTEKVISIKYVQPKKIEIEISKDMTLGIHFGYSVGSIPQNPVSKGIIQDTLVTISSATMAPFCVFHDAIMDFRNFLSLAVLQPVFQLHVVGKTEKNVHIIKDKSYELPIIIYYTIPRMPKNIEQESTHVLFRYRDIEEHFQKYYQNWIKNKETLQPIYNLYFGIVYNRHLYLEQKFLGMIQAVESFHRRTSTETELSIEEHDIRIKHILDNVANQYKEWLQNQLTYSNELTLRKRLNFLLQKFPQVIENYMSKSKFVNMVSNTRNYLTHYDTSLQSKIANDEQKIELYRRLMLLLECCLLSKLGFEQEKITDLIRESKTSKGLTP